MITEMDRAIALILICTDGPPPAMAEAKGWPAAQVRYGNEVLRVMAMKLREGLHRTIPDELVKKALAGDL